MSKRGDLLSLGLARLTTIAPALATIGLSATVAEPDDLRRYLVPQTGGDARADLVLAERGAAPDITMLDSAERLPWAGHSARHALAEIYALIKRHKMTLIFVNTRSQAESIFQQLWGMNDDNLAIALHHGSLDVAQRRRVEDAMAAGRLRAVVATSSLDLGSTKGGRSRHQCQPGRRIAAAQARPRQSPHGRALAACLVPANRFGCWNAAPPSMRPRECAGHAAAAYRVSMCWRSANTPAACRSADELYAEVRPPRLMRIDSRTSMQQDFVATGGYALKSYERLPRSN
jgi:ATP-dependent Lhr-like helicase